MKRFLLQPVDRFDTFALGVICATLLYGANASTFFAIAYAILGVWIIIRLWYNRKSKVTNTN